jgi:hypothetical protein
MSQVFLRRGDFYSQTEGNFEVMPTLDDGIYQIHQNPMTGEIFLERIADKFYFGFKLYGIDETFVTHVLDTYSKQASKHNLGVLLNGAKGTGKTVTAKMLCNKLGLPVLIVDKPLQGLSNFLAGINHDCVFLFDEFEKNFRLTDDDGEDRAGESLLSIMDGVYNGENCHIFIMTTNELRVNDNLLSRPSRIRYLKSFGDVIDRKILEEYVDDNLKYPQYRDEIMDFFDTLTIGTIDILQSLVDEVNLHNCGVSEFKDFFNVKEAHYSYSCKYWNIDLTEKDNPTLEEFIKHAKAPYSKELDWRPNWTTLKLKKSIKRYKVGEFINERYKIEEMHLDKSVIVLADTRYKDNKQFYYFEDVDEKPSIYDTNYRYTYGYGGYYDYDYD